MLSYTVPNKCHRVFGEILGRITSVALLSLGGLLEFVFHTTMLFPMLIYSIGKSIAKRKSCFNIPWQHLQRIQNSFGAILLGSPFAVIHPLMGLWATEASDKQIVMGMRGANQGLELSETPCSPVHAMHLVKDIADNNKTVFSNEHRKLIKQVRGFEHGFEVLQSQEFVQKVTNATLALMSRTLFAIEESNMHQKAKEVFSRIIGLLVPIFTAIDVALALILQSVFVLTGIVRAISQRGPIYTEVSWNPLMHIAFAIQNLLKAFGNIFCTFAWFYNPRVAFRASVTPSLAFFKMQLDLIICSAKKKIRGLKEGERCAFPLLLPVNGQQLKAFDVPTHTLHQTYVIVEKRDGAYTMVWTNRPSINTRSGMTESEAVDQLKTFFVARYPFMDKEKLFNYPVYGAEPQLQGVITPIADQGSMNNCVISNLFGMCEALDRLQGKPDMAQRRYRVVREYIEKKYDHVSGDFNLFGTESNRFTLRRDWDQSNDHSQPI
ncbi:MAG: hypothetical protein MRY21_06100 [Simkaniaceae bacterium]|nr:hypothetical protein [Simkaniaceae bacterium]